MRMIDRSTQHSDGDMVKERQINIQKVVFTTFISFSRTTKFLLYNDDYVYPIEVPTLFYLLDTGGASACCACRIPAISNATIILQHKVEMM
jgi:hypothetical protein